MSESGSEAVLAPGRSCDGCTLCCKLMKITALDKPRLTWCTHCEIGVGCKIYEQRPGECARFYCGYRLDARLGEEWRPADCGLLVSYEAQAKRVNVLVDSVNPEAWKAEPFYSQIKAMALSILRQRGHLIVWQGADGIGVLPHKNVFLGPPQPNQVVVAGRRLDENGAEEFELMVLDRDDPRLKPRA
jgi:hypothetical protein